MPTAGMLSTSEIEVNVLVFSFFTSKYVENCLCLAFLYIRGMHKGLHYTTTRGQSNLTKSASRGANSPVRGHPRGSKVVPLNSCGRVSY